MSTLETTTESESFVPAGDLHVTDESEVQRELMQLVIPTRALEEYDSRPKPRPKSVTETEPVVATFVGRTEDTVPRSYENASVSELTVCTTLNCAA